MIERDATMNEDTVILIGPDGLIYIGDDFTDE